jgi:hypothetical protein
VITIISGLTLLSGQYGTLAETPLDLLSSLRKNGLDIQTSAPSTSGWIVVHNQGALEKVWFTVGVDAKNRPTSFWLYNYHRFPKAVSLRALQDWEYASGCKLLFQTYLNKTVSASLRIDLKSLGGSVPRGMSFDPALGDLPRTRFKGAVDAAVQDFATFERWICTPSGGTAIDQMEFSATSDDFDTNRVVDYLDFTDVTMALKYWGWENTKPFGFPISSSWALGALIEKRQWIIQKSTKSLTALLISGTIVADAGVIKRFELNGLKNIEMREYNGKTTVTCTIELEGGISLGTLRSRILEFAHQVEQLGPDAE